MGKVTRFTATTVIAYLIYILLVLPLEPGELLLGAFAAVISAVILCKFIPFGSRIFNPLRIVRMLIYAPYFLWKMIVANVQIALIVINPILRIRPSIVKGRTTLKSNEGKLLLTSSITLTPGTLSMDVINDDIYVHRVTADKTEQTETEKEVIHPFEIFLKGVTE